YSADYAHSQNIFSSIASNDQRLLKIVAALLKASLIQMRVLSFIEASVAEQRPGIGNDVCDISASSFEKLIADYWGAVSRDRSTFVNEWIRAFADQTVTSWEAGLHGLFAPVGGPPEKPIG